VLRAYKRHGELKEYGSWHVVLTGLKSLIHGKPQLGIVVATPNVSRVPKSAFLATRWLSLLLFVPAVIQVRITGHALSSSA
jgi:hypothetical protein